MDKEVKQIIEKKELQKEEREEKEVSIIYDKKQYNIRIPKDFADEVGINPNKNKFKFTLIYSLKDKKSRLIGEFI